LRQHAMQVLAELDVCALSLPTLMWLGDVLKHKMYKGLLWQESVKDGALQLGDLAYGSSDASVISGLTRVCLSDSTNAAGRGSSHFLYGR